MQKSSVNITAACCLAIVVASCTRNQTSQTTQTTELTLTNRSCPPFVQLASIQPLGCYIDNNHFLGVGNPRPPAIPRGTIIFFTAKLENAGAFCASVPAPRPIPPHLFIAIGGQPLFDNDAPCQAWLQTPPVLQK
jgi:hypothetical protein